MVRLLIEDVTIVKLQPIHLHVCLRGGQTTSLEVLIPPKRRQARQTEPETLAVSGKSRSRHPDDIFGIHRMQRLNATVSFRINPSRIVR